MKHMHLKKSETLLLVILSISFLMIMTMFDLVLAYQRRSDVQDRINTVANYQLNSAVERYVTYSQTWNSVLLANNGEMDLKHFNDISKRLMEQYNDPAIRCIQLAPKGVIRYAYPLKGFESAIDGDLFSGHRKKECEYARDTGNAMMNGPYELTQGGISCIIRNPLYMSRSNGEKEFWGFSIIVLYFPEMLDGVDLATEQRMYDYRITHISEKTGEEEVILQSGDRALRSPVETVIPVPNGEWKMYTEWRNGWISVGEILFEAMILAIAVALAYAGILTDSRKRSNDAAVVALINESDEAMAVVAKDGSEVFMCNKAFRSLWGNRESFVPGLSYDEFFEHPVVALRELVENPETAVKSNARDSEIVVTTTENTWNGVPSYLLRGKEYDSEYFDHLTLLPNEFYFNKKAEAKIDNVIATGHEAACVFYDVVHMKLYNAQNGFEEGDRLLKDIAFILQEVYPNALISRFANDHYCLITPADQLEAKLKEVNDRVRRKGGAVQAEIKAGAYIVDPDVHLSVSQITDAAKMAADSIHDNVEQDYRLYDQELRKNLEDRKFIIDHLETAIQNGEIKVYYQPIVRTLTGSLCGYEALARWISPELGFLSPGVFIPILEQSHKIHLLDMYVIRKVCRDIRGFLDEGGVAQPISFNLSRLDFQLADVFKTVEDAVAESGIDRSYINIEITESVITDDDNIKGVIDRFHEAGYNVWMDDFGSGYSSLNTLKDYQFDKLKIDMVFLSSFTKRSRDIITSVVQMAKKIGIRTLAEGCETQEQYEFLREIGCEEVQGYYFGKPLHGRESYEAVTAKGIQSEVPQDAALYKAAGRTSMNPEIATAIMEYENDSFHYIYRNEACDQLLRGLGTDPETPLGMLNKKSSFYDRFRKRIKRCAETQLTEYFSFSFDGTYLASTASVIAQDENRIVCKLDINNTHVTLQKNRNLMRNIGKQEDRKTILITDDEPVNCVILGEMLKNQYNLIYAEDGERAMDIIMEDPDRLALVIIDAVMPRMDGLTVLRKLREDEKTRSLPVIMMTGAAELEVEILRAGVSQFLSKPLESKELVLAKVENVINRAQR